MFSGHRMGGRCVKTGAHGDTGRGGTMSIQLTCCQGSSVLANSPSLEVITEVIATSQLVFLLYQKYSIYSIVLYNLYVHKKQKITCWYLLNISCKAVGTA